MHHRSYTRRLDNDERQIYVTFYQISRGRSTKRFVIVVDVNVVTSNPLFLHD